MKVQPKQKRWKASSSVLRLKSRPGQRLQLEGWRAQSAWGGCPPPFLHKGGTDDALTYLSMSTLYSGWERKELSERQASLKWTKSKNLVPGRPGSATLCQHGTDLTLQKAIDTSDQEDMATAATVPWPLAQSMLVTVTKSPTNTRWFIFFSSARAVHSSSRVSPSAWPQSAASEKSSG